MILPEESLTRIAFQMNILIRHTDTVANVFETFVAYQTITNRSKANVTIVYLKLGCIQQLMVQFGATG